MTKGLAIAMIVRDERANLEELLPVLNAVADEVIVVDTGSVDGSAERARELGARVVEDPWADDFAKARNRGLDEVRVSHVLWLDADDRIEKETLARVREEALRRGRTGLFVQLVNEDRDPNLVTSCLQLRVFPNDPRHRFEGRVHEQIVGALARTGTPTETIDATIRHRGYIDPIDVTRKAHRNLSLLRRERMESGAHDLNVLYHLVKAASRAGELEEATSVARSTIENPPPGSPPEVLQALRLLAGEIEGRRGRDVEALVLFRDAVRERPNDPLARFLLAHRLRLNGELSAAMNELVVARGLPIESTFLPLPVAGLRRAIRFELGEMLELCAKPEDAGTLYDEILVSHPDDLKVLRAKARALLGAGRADAAAPILERLASLWPNDPEIQFLRATESFVRGDAASAKASFEAVLRRDPRQWAASLHLGHLALRQRDLVNALAHYANALEVSDNVETRLGMAAGQLEVGLARECLDHLAATVERCHGRPLPAGVDALAGEALLQLGFALEARDAFERHLRRFGSDARIVSRLSDCYRALGEPSSARVGYQEALRLDPGLGEAHEGLAALAS